jgi:hypothetical protein
MLIFIKLLLAHLIGDFVLQPYRWVEQKERKKYASIHLYYHCAVHTALVWIVLWDSNPWIVGLAIALVHWAIDLSKIYFQTPSTKTRWFVIDQLLHIVSLIAVWMVWQGYRLDWVAHFNSVELWVYATAVAILAFASKIVIETLMIQWSAVLPEAKNESLVNAGKYIGILERLLVFVFVVNGHWDAVGFLLAAKSVFRFGDLTAAKDRKLTEYILIGTLLSFGIAILTGMVVVKIIAVC